MFAPMVPVETCSGCGATVPRSAGPAHRYMLAAPGCWAAYGRVIAFIAENPELRAAQQYAVDAYAVQHPGIATPQAIQSVACHLISLYAYLEAGRSPAEAPALLRRLTRFKGGYAWLDPPASFEGRNVLDLARAGASDFAPAAHEWAESAWRAWQPHRARVAAWYAAYGRGG
jgi:Family of unknown function (DUF5946)